MRPDNVERLRGVYQEWARGNFRAGRELLAPDVTFVTFTSDADDLTFHGPDGVDRYMRDFLETWTDFRVQANDFRPSGERILVICEQRAKGRQSGVAVEMPVYAVWTFREDQVVRVRWLRDRDQAFTEAGLPA
jgi:ketosteroid isomerase-like protein